LIAGKRQIGLTTAGLNCILKVSGFETGHSVEKISIILFRIHSSLSPQPKLVYNSQLCAGKLEAALSDGSLSINTKRPVTHLNSNFPQNHL